MQLPLQVTFRHMAHSDAIEAIIREKAAKLDQFADHVMSCRVVIELAGKHHQHGNQYQVRIDLKVAGEEIAATREPGENADYRDIHVAIRDAFESVCRQLEDYVRQQHGAVKVHESPTPHGRVSKLFPTEGYGILATPDGREVYFHKNSVLHDGFARLEVGAEVSFVEEDGKKGPQASTVKLVGRHGRM